MLRADRGRTGRGSRVSHQSHRPVPRRVLLHLPAQREDHPGLEQFRQFLGGRPRLEKISPDHLERWAAELKAAEYASASIRRKFASLKVFFNYWTRRGLLDRSPAWKIRLDLAPQRVLTRVLTVQETKSLLRQAKRALGRFPRKLSTTTDSTFLALRNLAIVELLFATGIRIGELVGLRLSDFRPDDRVLTINGKGSRQRLAVLPDSKSFRAVSTYFNHRLGISTSCNSFFLNSLQQSLSAQGAANIVSSLADEAGITHRVTPHMLRHTVATLLLRNGADIRVVQEFLGHSTISTTQRYTHVSKDHMTSELQKHHPNRLYLSHR